MIIIIIIIIIIIGRRRVGGVGPIAREGPSPGGSGRDGYAQSAY